MGAGDLEELDVLEAAPREELGDRLGAALDLAGVEALERDAGDADEGLEVSQGAAPLGLVVAQRLLQIWGAHLGLLHRHGGRRYWPAQGRRLSFCHISPGCAPR